MHGGDFRQAGKRQGQELTTSYLRQLLEDDVRGLNRRKDNQGVEINISEAEVANKEMSDEDLDRLVDSQKIFEVDPNTGEYTFPTEGEMYDIVTFSTSNGLMALQGVE